MKTDLELKQEALIETQLKLAKLELAKHVLEAVYNNDVIENNPSTLRKMKLAASDEYAKLLKEMLNI